MKTFALLESLGVSLWGAKIVILAFIQLHGS